jgi:hypothetical protein
MPIAYQLRNISFSDFYWLSRIDPPRRTIVAAVRRLNRRQVAIVCLVNAAILRPKARMMLARVARKGDALDR